jgi:hypothetical protein
VALVHLRSTSYGQSGSNTGTTLPGTSGGYQPSGTGNINNNIASLVNQGVDPGLASAVTNYVPPKKPVNPNLGNTIQDYINQGITNQNQLAAQSCWMQVLQI